MKRILKIAGIFVLGLIIGAILMNLLHMYVRPTYREVIRTELNAEQEALARRTNRQGNKLRSASHRWNVVDSESEDGFRAFREKDHKDIDSSFLFPFHMVVLKQISSPNKESQKNGAKIVEGIDRGQLALSLEAIGETDEAARQWEMAKTLTRKKSVEDVKSLVIKLRDQETTDIYLQAEKAVLDRDKAQQQN